MPLCTRDFALTSIRNHNPGLPQPLWASRPFAQLYSVFDFTDPRPLHCEDKQLAYSEAHLLSLKKNFLKCSDWHATYTPAEDGRMEFIADQCFGECALSKSVEGNPTESRRPPVGESTWLVRLRAQHHSLLPALLDVECLPSSAPLSKHGWLMKRT